MDLQDWLITHIAEEAGLEKSEVSIDKAFEEFHLDSLSLVSLSYELENELNMEIDPTVFTEFNTIEKLISWIHQLK